MAQHDQSDNPAATAIGIPLGVSNHQSWSHYEVCYSERPKQAGKGVRKVALIQNQSEMAHYSYADARPLMRAMGYEAELFTANNVDELATLNDLKRFDALILCSNCFNDKAIRQHFFRSEFSSEISQFLELGRGIISFLQLRLAQDDTKLDFLRSVSDGIRAQVRPSDERAIDGSLSVPAESSSNPLLLYPNKIDIPEIERPARTFQSLPGLYWHYWGSVSPSEWDVLIEDASEPLNKRPLIISGKQHSRGRVVLSAMPVDWQRIDTVLINLVQYVVEGLHHIAILRDGRRNSFSFQYLDSQIKSEKIAHYSYIIDADLSAVKRNIENRIHSVVLLADSVSSESLPPTLQATIQHQIANGRLKMLSMGTVQERNLSFTISGRERFAVRFLDEFEIAVRNDLAKGYIDGSFWSTIETLQSLSAIPNRESTYQSYCSDALKQAATHDRDGSYDEVFGASAALYWLRAFALGHSHADSKSTERWLRANLKKYSNREQVQTLSTFAKASKPKSSDITYLNQLLKNSHSHSLSEIDLMVYLDAALSTDQSDLINLFAEELCRRQSDGRWLDIATTASITSLLVDVVELLRKRSDGSKVMELVEQATFRAIIAIQGAMERGDLDSPYIWDRKAATTAKCICAWLRFDRMIEFPVYECIDSLRQYDRKASQASSGRLSLRYLDELKAISANSQKVLAEREAEVRSLERTPIIIRASLVGAALVCYASLSFIAWLYMSSQLDFKAVIDVIVRFLGEYWKIHAGVIAAAGMAITFGKRVKDFVVSAASSK